MAATHHTAVDGNGDPAVKLPFKNPLQRKARPQQQWTTPANVTRWTMVRNRLADRFTVRWRVRAIFAMLTFSLAVSLFSCGVSVLNSGGTTVVQGGQQTWVPDPALTRSADLVAARWVEQANDDLGSSWEITGGGEGHEGDDGSQHHDYAVADKEESDTVYLLRVTAYADGATIAHGLLGQLDSPDDDGVTGVPCPTEEPLPAAVADPLDQYLRAYVLGDQPAMRLLAVADGPGDENEWPVYWQTGDSTPDVVLSATNPGERSSTTPDNTVLMWSEQLCWVPPAGDDDESPQDWGVVTVRMLVQPATFDAWVPDVLLLDVRVEVDAEPMRVYGASVVGSGGVG